MVTMGSHLRGPTRCSSASCSDELAAVRAALAAAAPGDVVLVLVHLDPAVDAFLAG